MTSETPTDKIPPSFQESLERTAFGLDAIQAENARMILLGEELADVLTESLT